MDLFWRRWITSYFVLITFIFKNIIRIVIADSEFKKLINILKVQYMVHMSFCGYFRFEATELKRISESSIQCFTTQTSGPIWIKFGIWTFFWPYLSIFYDISKFLGSSCVRNNKNVRCHRFWSNFAHPIYFVYRIQMYWFTVSQKNDGSSVICKKQQNLSWGCYENVISQIGPTDFVQSLVKFGD